MEAKELDYWGTDRASFEDELDAWRERTAFEPKARLEILPRFVGEVESTPMPTTKVAEAA